MIVQLRKFGSWWSARNALTKLTLREQGNAYATKSLESARRIGAVDLVRTRLTAEAENAFDFNDFDRGILDVVRTGGGT